MIMHLSFLVIAFAATISAVPGSALQQRANDYSTSITIEAHPLTYVPLKAIEAAATPISYGSPPTASKVPPGERMAVIETATFPSASYPAATSPSTSAPTGPTGSVCTVVQGSDPTSTLPAFCAPSYFVNAPALATPTGNQGALATAVVTLGAETVPDKVSCCGYCADYFNCYAWRFVPVYVGNPTPGEPGGFEPWKNGNCEIAYYTGDNTTEGVTTDCLASICPNGRLLDQTNGTNNVQRGSWTDGLYYNGWNEGACGNAFDRVFEKGSDPGYGQPLCKP